MTEVEYIVEVHRRERRRAQAVVDVTCLAIGLAILLVLHLVGAL